MRFVYTALRNLAPGHVVDDTYEIVIAGVSIDPIYKSHQIETRSLDRTVEIEVLGEDDVWSVVTDLIPVGQALDEFREFVHSTKHGETFSFDPDSEQVGVDVSARNVRMNQSDFPERPAQPGHKQFSLRMIET